ncbi:MAG: META domain-containing protein [Pseudomonadota bacterium]|nr:META domain-containing protein [Pseudomonadota bacterium]
MRHGKRVFFSFSGPEQREYLALIRHSSSEAARRALQTMKPARYFLVTALLAMAACHSNETQPDANAGGDAVTYELAGTRWALVQLGGKAVAVSEGGREAYLALNASDGSVVGNAGCNRLSSSYQQSRAQISFGELVTTRMFCPDMPAETALLQALEATAGWRIVGSQLELLDNRQNVVARFAARNL